MGLAERFWLTNKQASTALGVHKPKQMCSIYRQMCPCTCTSLLQFAKILMSPGHFNMGNAKAMHLQLLRI